MSVSLFGTQTKNITSYLALPFKLNHVNEIQLVIDYKWS